MARVWRVHHRRPPDSTEEDVVLSAEEGHHVCHVLRLTVGDPLGVFDGCGREWEGAVLECRPDRVVVRLGEELSDRVEPGLDIVLFQGMCRPERMEWVIQKGTECGLAAIRPLMTARSAQAAGGKLTDQRLARWRRVALEACKQSGRRRVPRVEPIDALPLPGSEDLALLLDPGEPEGPGVSGAPLAGRLGASRPRAVWLAVGPESGFAEDEIEAHGGHGWLRTGLGPRILRTETAGIVAAAIVLHRWADLGSAP